jgi:hypothetical protein
MKVERLRADLAANPFELIQENDAIELRARGREPFAAAGPVRFVAMALALLAPVPFLFSQEAMRYLFASMLACFAAATASIAASTDSLKRRAYHKPPCVRARRIRITSPDGDYRQSAREVKVVAINEHAAAAPRKVVMAVSTIVMRGGAPNSTQIHVSMVLDNLVARVASFPEEEDGIAEQFARTLSAAVGLPEGAVTTAVEPALENAPRSMWGGVLVTLGELAVLPALCWLLFPGGPSAGVGRVFAAVVVWIPIHFVVQKRLLTWLWEDLAGIMRQVYEIGPEPDAPG